MGNFKLHEIKQQGMVLIAKFVYRPKNKQGKRGAEDASAILDIIVENWDEIQELIEELDINDAKEYQDHFNSLIENEDDLGDILFGTVEDFKQRSNFLSHDDARTYTKELQRLQVVELA